VTGELADRADVGAGVDQVGAEGVAQHVRGAPVLRSAGGLGVTGDNARDVGVVNARGGWPVCGSDSSRCAPAAGGQTLTQATTGASASSSSGLARLRPRLP